MHVFLSYGMIIFRTLITRGTGLTQSTGNLHMDLSSYTLEAKAVSASMLLILVRNL